MSNTKFFNDAVAEAKEIRETALANAKLALEEAFTPQIQSMLEKKLSEEADDLDEAKDDMDEAKAKDMDEAKENTDESVTNEDARTDAEEEGYKDGIKDTKADIKKAMKSIKQEGMDDDDAKNEDARTDAEEEGYLDGKRDSSVRGVTRKIEKDKFEETAEVEEGAIEEIDLDELLAELEAAETTSETAEPTVTEEDESEDERADVDKFEYEKGEEAGKADDEDEVGEITVDELRDIIRDVITDVMGGGEESEEMVMTSDEEEIEIDEKKDADMDEAKKADMDEEKMPSQAEMETMGETKAELNEAIEVIKTLKSELNEVNLLNAKLLYVNKLFRNKTLTEAQKVKVINAFDRAETVKEVKNIFETIKDSITTNAKKSIQENRGFASKAAGVAPQKQPIVEGDDFVARMQKLAGIIN
jgi:hypothetical protein|tara:strand:+ start:274 stop:1524 length:1251 start_codon:yes stop_codon:yes gene_type:complete